ncbi:MAG: xanthine dehydrogenase family protein molybdopterin-binding subunit, partial [Parvibaculaceae bacterium]
MIGESPLRKEDARLLMGRANYVDNVHLDRMVHGVFVRSTMAHAEIVSIDPSAALKAGALCVLTAKDLPFNDKPWVVRYWHPSIRNGMPTFLPKDRVRFVGEPVAFVVAGSRYEAEDLAALVEIEYRPLPVVATAEAAMAPGAPQLHSEWPNNVAANFNHRRGNAAQALAGAVHRVKRRFSFVRQTPLPLETRGIVADFDIERQCLTVRMSTQAHYNVRQNLASILDVPEYQVRVIAEDVGGGFGAKSRTYAEEIIVSHASRVLRRPVKWIEDRFENLQATTHSRAVDAELELGCDADGTFTALNAVLTVDIGAYVFTSGVMTAEIAASHITNAYKIPNYSFEVRCVGTNKTPIATYRGAGQPESAFPTECLVDVLAKEIGLSAVELRRRNLIRPEDLPYDVGTPMVGATVRFESGNFPSMLETAISSSGFREDVETTDDGKGVGWGLACGIEGSGFVNFETANVRIDIFGNVTVMTGMSTQGQGQLTTYAQVCAEKLGVDFDRVTIQIGDTQLMPFGRGAFASRGAIFGANAVAGAAEIVRGKILAHAGTLLQIDPTNLTIESGVIKRIEGESTSLTVADIAQAVGPGGSLFSGDAALEAQYVFKADQPMTYGLSVHAVKVSLDPRTGFYKLLDYWVAHDA